MQAGDEAESGHGAERVDDDANLGEYARVSWRINRSGELCYFQPWRELTKDIRVEQVRCTAKPDDMREKAERMTEFTITNENTA